MQRKGIRDLPEEVFEYILSLLSPYRDLKNCMLVCKDWQKYVEDVVRRMQYDFQRSVSGRHLDWHHLVPVPGPTITKRYSHSACVHGTSMYVFGGCTTTSTTFNDLWRLDLASREWIRPLAMGTYPSPKACATMVYHNDNLYLFGGWTHPSPYPLHQTWKIFNQLHVYNPGENRWTQIVSQVQPPAMAGHSASMHRDNMVVFGGLQRQSNGQPYTRSSDLWVLKLSTMTWRLQTVTSQSPAPRYGQSQIYLDESHALVVGGCGGPNMLFNDMWLLTINHDSSAPWQWKSLDVKNQQHAAPHLWCHPACRVGNKVVVLSRSPQSKVSPTRLRAQLMRPTPSRAWVPPIEDEAIPFPLDRHDNRLGSPNNTDQCVNGRQGTFRRPTDPRPNSDLEEPGPSNYVTMSPGRQSPSRSSANDVAVRETFQTNSNSDGNLEASGSYSGALGGSLDGPSTSQGNAPSIESLPSGGANYQQHHVSFRNTPFPSVRPNPMRNRQRQLEGLRRMEERIRNLAQRNQLSLSPASGVGALPGRGQVSQLRIARNPMVVYVADISRVLDTGEVTWIPLHDQSPPDGPEDTMLYSLVEGRGELIMFGGIQRDPGSAAGVNNNAGGGNIPDTVSNSVHFILPQKWVI